MADKSEKLRRMVGVKPGTAYKENPPRTVNNSLFGSNLQGTFLGRSSTAPIPMGRPNKAPVEGNNVSRNPWATSILNRIFGGNRSTWKV